MDLHTNKIYISKHVRFDEAIFLFSTKTVLQAPPVPQSRPWAVFTLQSYYVPSTTVVPVSSSTVQSTSSAPVAPPSRVHASKPTTRTHAMVVKYPEWRVAMDNEFNVLLQNQIWTLLDVHNGFLNGNLAETIYMRQPPGYTDEQFPNHVCLLKRSLYGLKQYQNLVNMLLSKFSAAFKIRDLGEYGFFLQRYMTDILKRAGMSNCKPLATPIPVSKSLPPCTNLYHDHTQYRSLVGTLQYMTITRHDLSFAINKLCQHMHALTVSHWVQLKRVLRYVKGTITYGLRIHKSVTNDIHAFSDSDWTGCSEDRKSTSGYVVFLGSNLVSWVCKKQRIVARSSTETEYKALADACAEVKVTHTPQLV
ncbi:PREDICTED: uncharacterized protein LOC109148672 [Ipomoea nil]|uniref:uncharacterized protein LOC109148672 n=1 Tax=Ipomoea nil TaxID=35883 RepID=UPI0009014A26|nr:PREDICTED: uncharacterized protein LOC109148672 [Ipomoea nil]